MKKLAFLSILTTAALTLVACGADTAPAASGTGKQTLATAAQPNAVGECPMAGAGDCSACPHNQDGQCNCPNRAADGGAAPGTCPHHQAGQGMNGQAGGCRGMSGQGMGGQGMGGQGAGCQGMSTGECAQMNGGQGSGSCPHRQAGTSGEP